MAKIILTELRCNQTEDNMGSDECQLRIWADGAFQTHQRDMTNGDTWPLNIPLEFSNRVKIQLWDLDNPGFPLFDDHDHLGTVIVLPAQQNGSDTFTQDGADYELVWVAG